MGMHTLLRHARWCENIYGYQYYSRNVAGSSRTVQATKCLTSLAARKLTNCYHSEVRIISYDIYPEDISSPIR